MRERGLDVDHSTIFRRVQPNAPEINKRIRQQLKVASDLTAPEYNFRNTAPGRTRS